MIKPSRIPDGFKNLLAYQKAEIIQSECSRITEFFPKTKTAIALADQMNRSARSGKQNIVEGWKRNSTKEYYEFLGFSIGANKELEEDCNDIWKGYYPDLMGVKGIMGEKGASLNPLNPSNPSHPFDNNPLTPLDPFRPFDNKNPLNPLDPFHPFDIEKLKFYPLNESLPPIVKLKLRCKELDFLLHKLQLSLVQKMEQEKTLSSIDRYAKIKAEGAKQNHFAQNLLKKFPPSY